MANGTIFLFDWQKHRRDVLFISSNTWKCILFQMQVIRSHKVISCAYPRSGIPSMLECTNIQMDTQMGKKNRSFSCILVRITQTYTHTGISKTVCVCVCIYRKNSPCATRLWYTAPFILRQCECPPYPNEISIHCTCN